MSLEISKLRDNLELVAVLYTVSNQISIQVLEEVMPSVLNTKIVGLITPLNDSAFVIPLASIEEVKEVCKLGEVDLSSKQGACHLSITPWLAEIGTMGRASDAGEWITSKTFPYMDGAEKCWWTLYGRLVS